jgi:hypothetical protein
VNRFDIALGKARQGTGVGNPTLPVITLPQGSVVEFTRFNSATIRPSPERGTREWHENFAKISAQILMNKLNGSFNV